STRRASPSAGRRRVGSAFGTGYTQVCSPHQALTRRSKAGARLDVSRRQYVRSSVLLPKKPLPFGPRPLYPTEAWLGTAPRKGRRPCAVLLRFVAGLLERCTVRRRFLSGCRPLHTRRRPHVSPPENHHRRHGSRLSRDAPLSTMGIRARQLVLP